ncbi:MAG: NAD(P)/FAD-dependent oxidoreductase [Kiritimatiellaeota bacterium]|nr:NAD(P)/FAD-dependent oxidoreductase [Kiritimatiellota bacterium]
MKTEKSDFWDVVILGAGPAGLSAALTTAHRGLKTLIIEAKEHAGGQPSFLYSEKRIIDIPGFPDGITGADLSDRVYRQALNAEVEFRFNEELVQIDDTDKVEKDDSLFCVITDKAGYHCRKVIIAVGLLHYPRKLPLLDALKSDQVFYKIPKISDYSGKRVAITGGGDSALDAAVMVLERHGAVDLIIREDIPAGKEDTLKRIKECGGDVHTSSEIVSAAFSDNLFALDLGGDIIHCDIVIVQIGFLSAKDTFKKLNIKLKDDSSVAVDSYFETSREGVFAAGDVHGDIELITVAWAEGIQAAIYAFKEISSPYWLNERRLKDRKMSLISEKIIAAASGNMNLK